MKRRESVLGAVLVLTALVLFAWTHRYALTLPGVAEDIGIVQQLADQARQGGLIGEVWLRFTGPLWGPGSTMWRPWAYASLGLDALLYGESAAQWRYTNLLLHLAAASGCALLAYKMLMSPIGASAAFAVVLLNPWSAEITLWIVGRFDGWATAAMALSLWTLSRSGGRDRWLVASLILAAVAYMSKESALLLPGAVFCLLVFRVATRYSTVASIAFNGTTRNAVLVHGRAHAPAIALHLGLALLYLALRHALVDSAGLNVYSTVRIESLGELLVRLAHHLQRFAAVSELAPKAASLMATFVLLSIIGSLRTKDAILVWSTGCAIVAATFIGAAWHFDEKWGIGGDGDRIYYVAMLGFALMLAAGVVALKESGVILVLVCSVTLAFWQDRVNREWWYAASVHRDVLPAISQAIEKLPREAYSVVFLPDPIGRVPWARNANGSIVRAAQLVSASQRQDYNGFMVAFLPTQLDQLRGLLGKENFVGLLTNRIDAPKHPTVYFCFEPGQSTLSRLDTLHSAMNPEAFAAWRVTANAYCPSLKL
ncbi:MAG: hypothetical protein EAZ43_07355 [Betaproteobacteria bacterium]|nr:MAG: hypothetical protein EAZ43_07355 [Betaproteobacteria bacterium]